MERIIATLVFPKGFPSRDLDIPSDITAEALAQEVASALGLSGRYEVYADSGRRVLLPQEPLKYAGVWDGAVLIMQPLGSAVRTGAQPKETDPQVAPPSPPPEQPPDSPVRGWRRLDIPRHDSPEETPPPRTGGFTWKRIDED